MPSREENAAREQAQRDAQDKARIEKDAKDRRAILETYQKFIALGVCPNCRSTSFETKGTEFGDITLFLCKTCGFEWRS